MNYQELIDETVFGTNNNCFISAGAGCGKTTTITRLFKRFSEGNPDLNIGFVAFNKSIAEELKLRGVNACTLHSLGLNILRKTTRGKLTIENRKTDFFSREINPDFTRTDLAFLNRIISLIKNCLMIPNSLDQITVIINQLILDYNIDLDRVPDELVLQVWIKVIKESNIIDFDDMIFRPNLLINKRKQFDILFIDESQDLNNAQIQMIRGISDRYIFVGDPFQSIYGFRGANTEAVQDIIKSFNCTELSLPVTYRCPKSHVSLINKLFPEIPFICGNNNDGVIFYQKEERPEDRIINKQNQEMVLCRTNAPLISHCFKLIKLGIKATIRGRDIGQGLITLIDKSRQTDLKSFLAWLDNWYKRELDKLEAANRPTEVITDKYECLIALSENIESLIELKTTIDKIFSDDNGTGIICSSIHRAKGLESDIVRIIRPDLLPFKGEKVNKVQERNCHYVALTRSKNRLIFDYTGIKKK